MKRSIVSLTVAASLALTAVAFAVQKDWTKYTSKEGSLSINAPEAWILGDAKDPAFKEQLEKIKQNNPKLATFMNPATDEKVIAMLFDTSDEIEDGHMDNVQIMKQPHGGLTTKMYGDVAKQMAKMLQIEGKMQHKVIDTAGGKTLTYWYTQPINLPTGQKLDMGVLGAMFLKGENLYIITFGTGGKLAEKRPVWDEMLKSIKLN
ncbi:MAG TPA: hypothetical protein VEX38_06850 [Fimbriimonadaceae bacterium]|nr:hypothetical protein [Fimbriimonadaceae bacterium]